jgi:ribosomal protein S15P/S13E
MAKASSGKKQRKHGRSNRNNQNTAYKNERRCLKNKIKRLLKHLKRFPDDHCATRAVGNLRTTLGVRTV